MSLTAHERFLQGMPLTDAKPTEPERPAYASSGDGPPSGGPRPLAGDGPRNYERTLSRAERVRLAELRGSEGWPVLTWLLERAMQIHRRNAITMSTVDPLANQAKIAEQWAYVAMMERALAEMKGQVDSEIAQLEVKQ